MVAMESMEEIVHVSLAVNAHDMRPLRKSHHVITPLDCLDNQLIYLYF